MLNGNQPAVAGSALYGVYPGNMGRPLVAMDAGSVLEMNSPPRIIMENKVYFNVDIVIGVLWRARHHVTIEDIWRGGLGAEIVLEGAPDLRVTSCNRCRRASSVVDLRTAGTTEFGPITTPGDSGCFERFRFDHCRSHCSSSRLHLGSRLILAIKLPTGAVIFSDPFELLSKRPSLTKSPRPRPSLAAAAAAAGDTVLAGEKKLSSPPARKTPRAEDKRLPTFGNTLPTTATHALGTTETVMRSQLYHGQYPSANTIPSSFSGSEESRQALQKAHALPPAPSASSGLHSWLPGSFLGNPIAIAPTEPTIATSLTASTPEPAPEKPVVHVQNTSIDALLCEENLSPRQQQQQPPSDD